MECTLVVIKPDGVRRDLVEEIKNRLRATGLQIVAEKTLSVDAKFASTHYADLGERKGEAIKNRMVAFLTSGPVTVMIIQGDNAIAEVRRIVGDTEPISAGKGTIRGDLADDSYKKADAENRAVENLIHASDGPDTARTE
ncbi:MAG: nucleoside-diphosphate kinase, partial [Patescibacteria group bacterium]